MRILCIDDDELGLALRKVMLEQEGHTVLLANSGEAGLKLLRAYSVDVVVLDYNMPGLDGAEVARIIKQMSPDLPVIMLSGCTNLVPRVALDLVSVLLSKGGSPEQLLMAVDKVRSPAPATILNVDDNDQHRYSITRLLQKAGFSVLEASTGTEALSKAAGLPDLIVLDVNLPDMLGFEVCKRLKANPATQNIPVIHVSATYHADSAQEEALKAGAECFLEQPQDPAVVVELVRAKIRKRPPAI